MTDQIVLWMENRFNNPVIHLFHSTLQIALNKYRSGVANFDRVFDRILKNSILSN